MNKVVVTGCAGFIGGHLTSYLLDNGYQVLGIDDLSTSGEEVLKSLKAKGLDFYKEDVRNFLRVKDIFEEFQPDFVFHQAAYAFVEQSFKDPDHVMSINVEGTRNIAELSRNQNAGLVYASSSAVYGDNPSPQKTSGKVGPTSPYADSKLLSEKAVEEIQNLKSVGLRYFNVYGPYQSTAYGSVIPAWFTAAKEKRPLQIYGSGDISRDFTYVDDVVTANILAKEVLEREKSCCKVFNVGTEKSTTLSELRRNIQEICEKHYSIETNCPDKPMPMRKGDVKELLAGDENILNYHSTIDMIDGLKKSAWFYMKEKG